MAKITNLIGQPISILRFVILPDGKLVENITKRVYSEPPGNILYTPQIKHLIEQKLITVEGLDHLIPQKEEPKPAEIIEPKEEEYIFTPRSRKYKKSEKSE